MIKRSSQPLCVWFLAWDVALTALAWIGAYVLRVESGWLPLTKEPPDFALCLRNLPLVILSALVAYRLAGQYDIHRLRRFREEVMAIGRGVALLALLVLAMHFFRQDRYESRGIILLFAALTACSVLILRRLTWTVLRRLRARGYNTSRAVIVGTGRVAQDGSGLAPCVVDGNRAIGFVEDRVHPLSKLGPVLGGIAELPRLIEEHAIEHVFIALPMSRFADVRRVFDTLSQQLVEVRLVVDAPDMAGLSLTTTNLDGLPVVGLRESPHFGLNVVIKRVMDVTLASLAVVLLAPLLAVIAVLVKLSSPGPIFYRQERCGLNGKPFWMLKFRSMPVDAEARSGPVWASREDRRATRLGAFLRKTSLDELPQLFNVIWGDMSLVGPRPERPVFIQQFSKTIPNYMARHCVKAGITGWAQVNGWRGNTSLRRRVQFDLYYITHWNPWFDLRIMVLTVFKGLRHRNAY